MRKGQEELGRLEKKRIRRNKGGLLDGKKNDKYQN